MSERANEPVVRCPYCLAPAQRFGSAREVDRFNGRDDGPVWGCSPCRAWARVSQATGLPTARLADGHLRARRGRLMELYVPLVHYRASRDRTSYREAERFVKQWLADAMKLPDGSADGFLIGWLDLTQVNRAIAECSQAVTESLRQKT